MATFQFEDILPWGTTGGDTGLSSRMKLKRNFDKIKLYLEALPDFDGILANIMTLQSYFNGGAALQAVKLKTARSLWGQTFDGSADVTGTLQSVADIEMTGALKMAFGNSWFEQKLDANGDLQLSGNVYALGAVSCLGVSAAGTDAGGSGATSLSELSDTAIALPMSAGQALVFDNGKWRNRLLTWSDLSGKPATFPPSEHSADHDVRYYIENGTIHLGNNSITPITSHQSLAAYTPTANYQALNIKVGSTTVGTYAPTQALTFSIVAGSNISVTADATNKKITIANTYSYTHPTNGANTTITAANGKVLSAITVNNLGHVTSVGSKTLVQADIPALDASKITSGTFDVARIPDLSSIYLLKVAGESYPITNSLYVGSTTGRGVYVKDPAGNYVPAFYQNGENLWIGSTQTLATHHRGQTYISAGYDGAHGNKTIYVCVPNDSNNGGTNYGVWHSGNDGDGSGLDADLLDGHDSSYFATTSALTTLAGTVSTQGGRISALEGYFDNGVANSAKRLSGTASYTVWGQTYWENGVPKGNVKDTLYMLATGADVNSDSAKLKFNSYDADGADVRRSPYIQAMYEASHGRKRLSVFQSNAASWGSDFVEAFTILPNGNVGIGTTTPSQKLHVVGNIMATGAVSCLGTSAEGSEVTGAVFLRDLQDVLITGTPQTNYVLTFNGSKWVPQASQGGDMSQYLLKGGDTMVGNLIMNGAGIGFGPNGNYGYIDYSNSQLRIGSGIVHIQSDGQFLFNGAQVATEPWANGRFVTALGTSGNYLTYTKNGSTTNLTVPFATNADTVDGKHASAFVPKEGYFYQMDGTAVTPVRILLPLAAGSTGTYSLDLSGYLPLTAGADKAVTGILWMDNNLVMANPNHTTNDDSTKIAFYTNKNYPNISPYIQALYEGSYGRKRLSVFQKATEDWNTPQTEVLSIMPDGKLRLTQAISYKGTQATYDMISFVDNASNTYGNGIAIGGGGATIIGGGESASMMAGQLSSGGDEVMFVGNDGNVTIYTNLGTTSGWEGRKEFLFDTSGRLWFPTNADGRRLLLHQNGTISFRARSDGNGWATAYGAATNDGSTSLGVFGALGEGNTLSYMYIGPAYNNTWMAIPPSGNVGIGTISPSYKLDVNGDMRAAGHIYGGNCLWLPVAGSIFIDEKNILTYNSSQMLSLGYGLRDIAGTKTDIYGKQVEIKEQKLKIGDCIIEWDSTHGMLKFSNGIYSMGAVSALGVAGDINGVVTKPMTFAADVTMRGTLSLAGTINTDVNIGNYTKDQLTQSRKIFFGDSDCSICRDSSDCLHLYGNDIVIDANNGGGDTVYFNGNGDFTGDVYAGGEVRASNDVAVGRYVTIAGKGYLYTSGNNLYWHNNATGANTKIA